jgi:4-hydroxy-3-methylbut-2-enyl diphosphate reductase
MMEMSPRFAYERFPPNLRNPPSGIYFHLLCHPPPGRHQEGRRIGGTRDRGGLRQQFQHRSTRGCRLENGAKAAYRIDYASEIQQDWLDGIGTVGVTSGASVPEVLVQEVLDARLTLATPT